MNEVFLIGRLVKDPELNVYGSPCCKFTIAVDRDKNNGEDRGTDFIRITVWGKLGEACTKYLKKGSLVSIRGKIRTDNFKNNQNENVFVVEIVADRVRFLSRKKINQR